MYLVLTMKPQAAEFWSSGQGAKCQLHVTFRLYFYFLAGGGEAGGERRCP